MYRAPGWPIHTPTHLARVSKAAVTNRPTRDIVVSSPPMMLAEWQRPELGNKLIQKSMNEVRSARIAAMLLL